jgi:hypothetical protein
MVKVNSQQGIPIAPLLKIRVRSMTTTKPANSIPFPNGTALVTGLRRALGAPTHSFSPHEATT